MPVRLIPQKTAQGIQGRNEGETMKGKEIIFLIWGNEE